MRIREIETIPLRTPLSKKFRASYCEMSSHSSLSSMREKDIPTKAELAMVGQT